MMYDEASGKVSLLIKAIGPGDEGEYTCIAENNAGRLQSQAYLKVIVRPRVQELFNHTYPVGQEGAALTCLASGDPLPKIVWRKWSRK